MSKTIVQRIAERFNNLTPEEREKLNKRLEELRGGKDAPEDEWDFDEDEWEETDPHGVMRDLIRENYKQEE